MRIYEHLFFDLDNTLWDFTANSKIAMHQTLEQKGILSKLDSFDVFFQKYEQINKSLWKEYHSKRIDKKALIVERFSRSLQQFSILNLNWEEINREYLEFMALQTGLFPGTIETLSLLQAKGYQMHIITNGFSEVQHEKIKNCGLSGFFQKVFISEEIKTTKPHREIYEHALKSTNAKKRKSIMIGDSWETDIQGAMDFGLDQVMFLNQGLNELPESINSMQLTINTALLLLKPPSKTYFIQKIKDLLEIL
jgi:putative hydrolase of the HAD superfamily